MDRAGRLSGRCFQEPVGWRVCHHRHQQQPFRHPERHLRRFWRERRRFRHALRHFRYANGSALVRWQPLCGLGVPECSRSSTCCRRLRSSTLTDAGTWAAVRDQFAGNANDHRAKLDAAEPILLAVRAGPSARAKRPPSQSADMVTLCDGTQSRSARTRTPSPYPAPDRRVRYAAGAGSFCSGDDHQGRRAVREGCAHPAP